MAEIIDGRAVAAEIRAGIRKGVEELKKSAGSAPGLAVVLIGDNPASAAYVRMKGRACDEAGFTSFQYTHPASMTETELLELVGELNSRKEVNGILVQMPLPKHIDESRVINAIDPSKDVDGFHPVNVGKMVIGNEDCFYPCTPYGCQVLINRYVKDIKGKHLVVVGRSNIVGKPMANLMYQKRPDANCVVTICHTAAPDISYYTRQADILVVAAGRAGMITADMVKDGVVVIDVGQNRVVDPGDPSRSRMVGDVDYEGLKKKASAITPVPGGVGPMTIAILMQNTLKAFRMQNGL